MTTPERSAADEVGTPGSDARTPLVADRRGLTAFGGTLLALVAGAAGLGYDLSTGTGQRVVFAVCFIAGCAVATLVVHREDLFAMVVMPPLAYLALSVATAVLQHARTGSLLTQQAIGFANTVVLGAPVLISATAAAALLALVRAVLGRHR